MDNLARLYIEYDDLLSERNQLVDYLILHRLTFTEHAQIIARIDDIDDAIDVVASRLERVNIITQLLEKL